MYRKRNHPRGTVLIFAIVMSVVMTGMVLSMAWVASIQAQTSQQYPKLDAAFYASEAGMNHAVWKFRNDNQWRATSIAPLTGSISMLGDTYTFSVTATDAVGNATLAWSFNEGSGATTADTSGRGNTGTFRGGATWTSQGRSGSAVRLNGTSAYVDCGNGASTNLTGDMTFSAWCKLSSAAYDQKIGANQNGYFGGYKLCIYNSKVEFEVRNASNQYYLNREVVGGTILTQGTWYHVVGIYSETGHYIKTYVNGTLDRQISNLPANALGSTSGTFIIGREPYDTANYFFGGDIDDIRIFARVLSDQEIKALYDTTIDISSTATNGRASNTIGVSASIPTPPAPTVPAITLDKSFAIKNTTINGDLAVKGTITGNSGNSTINGNITYGGSYNHNNRITVTGNVGSGTVTQPTINYAAIKQNATDYGQVVNGDSNNKSYEFTSLGGNKVIWIKGNLTNPTVTYANEFAAGGTFIVDGNLTFSNGSTTLGRAGFPVNFIVLGNLSHTGGRLTLVGSLYVEGNWARKQADITGNIWVKGNVTDNTSGNSTYTASAIPWFDNRAVPQSTAALPVYFTSFKGGMP